MVMQTTDQCTYETGSSERVVDGNASDADSTDDNTACVNKTDPRGMPAGCVFVASLSKVLKDSELSASVFQHFSQWGLVLNVKVFRDWMQRPYGFVQFASIEDAQTALKEASGTVLNGRYIRCEPARVNRTIYLGQMPEITNKTEVQKLAESYGEVEDITMIKTGPTQSIITNAFIRYRYRDDAIKAYLATYRDPPFQASTVEWASNLNKSTKKSNDAIEGASSSTLVIKNFPPNINQDDLRNRLTQYGTVKSVVIIGRSTMPKRGVDGGNIGSCYALVRYENYETAKKARESENGSVWNEYTIKAFLKDSNSQLTDSTKVDKFRKPHPPGRSVTSAMHKLNMARSQKIYNQTVNRASSCKLSVSSTATNYSNIQTLKRENKARGKLANNMPRLCQYPIDSQIRSVMQPCAGGYQGSCSSMTYIPSHYNTPDLSGSCYSLPTYHYCVDYGLGFYYSNGYVYPGPCYPVTPPATFGSMSLSSADRKAPVEQNLRPK
ncbi:hypothetical protein BGW37DRAFT_540014 [Umbelopsis sp. PMI_123]|nr:hypothetical protein BGW37DRAFT_540014 [Umbelopsis sp. PMI_123]